MRRTYAILAGSLVATLLLGQTIAEAQRKWLDEDVVYIINTAERNAFLALRSDPERTRFIEQFWERRDPTPGTPKNEFQEEHYRRIGFTMDRFGTANKSGWRTDRGRVYITHGAPDEIDQKGAAITWTYRLIEGVGRNVIIEFRDTQGNGEYPMTRDPNAR